MWCVCVCRGVFPIHPLTHVAEPGDEPKEAVSEERERERASERDRARERESEREMGWKGESS